MTKRILGLDLGTNSIGWALVENDFEKKKGKIVQIGSRIIPMSQDIIDNFGKGQSRSQTSERTGYRSKRKLYQRDNLRRERLHRVLNVLGFLPEHYRTEIDFENKLGQFKKETKVNYCKDDSGNYKFLFVNSFNEMVDDFRKEQPDLFYKNKKGKETEVPYDWTLYYLRKKALNHKISKEELAWLLLNFNQKRGYYQLRGEEEEAQKDKNKSFEVLRVSKVVNSGEVIKKSGEELYDIYFDNDWKYDKQTTKPNDWIGKTKEFIVTTSTLKDGSVKRTYKIVDSEKDWIAIKEKTQQDIDTSGKTVGEYIYQALKSNPTQKIRGKLIKTIERKYYKEELQKILSTQIKHHPELTNNELYKTCVNELYGCNYAHQTNILKKEKGDMFLYLFMEDIIFYQRPLKSKKATISDCQYETRKYKIKDNQGNVKEVEKALKTIPKSHPLFIEFRLWQFLKNLRIYRIEGTNDIDVTDDCIRNEEEWCDLFDYLNEKKEVEQKNILEYLVKLNRIEKKAVDTYRWNYVTDKKYPVNETRFQIVSRLKKVKEIRKDYALDSETEKHLWHIIYSVKDKQEYSKALTTFALKNNFDLESFVSNFEIFPPFKSEYGAYSEKAIKKLLPFMRVGRYWEEADLDEKAKNRITSIIERIEHLQIPENEKINDKRLNEAILLVSDDEIPSRFIKSFLNLKGKNPFSRLNTYQACYAVYERYTEVNVIQQWKKPEDIDAFLYQFKQHSLRNPIVEQVVLETLRVVRDIWKSNLEANSDFEFTEIHLELGRDIKNPKEKRTRISELQAENENTNNRIRLLLEELKKEYSEEDIRPFSPSHQEILKIYEEGVYQNSNVSFATISEEDMLKIRKNTSPTPSEITRYKLWLEQNYISPYTGQPIPLSRLFSTDYQIEHIIPQSRFFDDSLSNKIICESAVNELKSNQTAYEFLKNASEQIVDLGNGKTTKLLSLETYVNHCESYFKKNRIKLKNLLSEEVPEGFINRQKNDSRYISTYVKALLSNIVREDNEKEATAKKLIPVSGAITNKLKQDWKLNDVWNKIIEERFKRLNKLTKSEEFGYRDFVYDESGNKKGNEFFRLITPKEVNKKRIDHRHHALDALVIACCTKDHINYITSLETERTNHALVSKLRHQKEVERKNKKGEFIIKKITTTYKKPWESFVNETQSHLEKLVVSFKQNTRIINKTNNTYLSYKDEQGNLRLNANGIPKKGYTKQIKGDNWAIRKSLHQDTFAGLFNIKVPRGKIATSVRTSLTEIKSQKQIEKITDPRIREVILPNHLKKYLDKDGTPVFSEAFSEDGIKRLNENIFILNEQKPHHPIFKVKMYEVGSKFSVSDTLNSPKSKKYVEAAKGTNLFFAVYWNEKKKKREFETIPLNEVITHQKWRATLSKNEQSSIPFIPVKPNQGRFLFSLSPNDLVYMPIQEEIENPQLVDFEDLNKEQVNRIYKMVSSSGTQCFFIKGNVAKTIKDKFEFSALNKMEKSNEGMMIKNDCWKLAVDRLGNITNVIRI